jgi:phage shock protein A
MIWKRLNDLLRSNPKKEDGTQKTDSVLLAAVAEIDHALKKNQLLADNLVLNKNELYRKLEAAKQEKAAAEYDLKLALRKNDKFQADLLMTQKTSAEESCRELELLYTNLLKTLQQLERQIQKMKSQKTELLTKHAVLSATVQSADNQKELEKIFRDLQIDDELEAADDKILLAETELALSDDYLSVDAQIKRIENGDNNSSADNQYFREKEALRTADDAAKQKKIEQIFASQKTPEVKKNLVDKKQELLKQLLAQQSKNNAPKAEIKPEKTPEKEDLMKNFFDKKTSEKNSAQIEDKKAEKQPEKENILKNFFDKTPSEKNVSNNDEKKSEKPPENPAEKRDDKDDFIKNFFDKK